MRFALALTLLVAVVGCATVHQEEINVVADPAPLATPPATSNPAQIDAAVAALKTYTFGQSREPLAEMDRLVMQSQSSQVDRAAIATKLAALLSSDATFDAKQYACRKLVLVGSAETVPAVAPLLLDEKTVDMARYALEPLQGSEADQALLDALPKAPDAAKVGILNSLGARKTAAAETEIQKLTQSADPAVAEAAKAALARIRT